MKNISKLMVALFIAIFLTTNSWTQKELANIHQLRLCMLYYKMLAIQVGPIIPLSFQVVSAGYSVLSGKICPIKEFNNSWWKVNKKPRC
ncbi:hypothetical protein [Candidatus Coxiella mudrowiae]|uniref:hypothetical protein n=1 Tax=Candidatus Coxiella mudrowiae TaxID=2054173 RepID=UPI000C28DB9D|nr:hypothetical protein [Candidatus Coxiella mudrowiae]